MTPYSRPLPRRPQSTSLLPDPWDINSQMMQPPGIKQTLNKLERVFWFHSRRHGLSQVPVTELELVALHGWAGYLCQSKWMKNTGHSSKTGFQLLTACFYRHLADARFKLQICRPEGHESREQGTDPAWVRPSLPL